MEIKCIPTGGLPSAVGKKIPFGFEFDGEAT